MWRDPPHVYFLRPAGERGPVKIGWSVMPAERLRTYQSWSPVLLELVARTPGGATLEGQLHAHFAHLHLHGEWFSAAPELDAVIDAINAGAFSADGLPDPRRIQKKIVPPESIHAARMSRHLSDLRDLGVHVPSDVLRASSTYGHGPQEVARRRAVVAEFVNQHAHLREQAKAAAAAKRSEIRARYAQGAA